MRPAYAPLHHDVTRRHGAPARFVDTVASGIPIAQELNTVVSKSTVPIFLRPKLHVFYSNRSLPVERSMLLWWHPAELHVTG